MEAKSPSKKGNRASRLEAYLLKKDKTEGKHIVRKKKKMDPTIETIPFIIKKKFQSEELKEEYIRQITRQQDGLGELTIGVYLKNRQAYRKRKEQQKAEGKKNPSGRSPEGSKAQAVEREKALAEKVEKLMDADKTLSEEKAEALAKEWIKTQAALHDPDQIAGGNPENITGMGDARINSSIGSQWQAKSRADDVEEQVWEYIEKNNISEDEWDGILLSIEIKYVCE